ncbi:polysaccharide deacetylase family protein [Deinococcus sp. UYEF24]
MSNPSRRQVLSWLPAAFLLARASTLAAGTQIPVRVAPLPLVQPASFPATSIPGAVQPLAPGAMPAAALPQIPIPGLPELHRCEYASNGFLEAAHAVLLIPAGKLKPGLAGSLARTAVQRAFVARPGLSEVAVSVYRSEGYQGFGGPSPLLTVSVPSIRLNEFVQSAAPDLASYDRAWTNPDVSASIQPTTSEELEVAPVFVGSAAELASQRVQQLAAQLSGGVHGGLFFHGAPLKPDAALSFDDAPHPIYAPLLLDTLRRANVKATFFCIGRNARAYPYYVKDIAAQGHEIGNHTFHHVRLTDLAADAVEDEIRQCSDVLSGITGKPVRYFRPPGGRYSPATLQTARSLGLTTAFWTDDPADFNNPGQAVLEARLSRNLRAGGIVLLHDNILESLRVLPQFAQYAAKRQIHLGTLSTLAALS